MNENMTALILTVGLFLIAVLPLLIDNLRTGKATNRNNLILALAGIFSIIVNHLTGWNHQSIWAMATWIVLGGFGLAILSVVGLLPGGVAKTMMALLPWFTVTDYLLMILIGFIVAGVIALVMRRNVPMAWPLAISCIGLWSYDFTTLVTA